MTLLWRSFAIFGKLYEAIAANYKIASLFYTIWEKKILSIVLCLTLVLWEPMGFKTTYYLYIQLHFSSIYTIFIFSTIHSLLCIVHFVFYNSLQHLQILFMMIVNSSVQLQLESFQNTCRVWNIYEFILFSIKWCYLRPKYIL